MEYRTLDITSISAKGLKNSSFFSKKMDTYAVVSISETTGKLIQKIKTSVCKNRGSYPKWDSPVKFTVNEAAVLKNRLTLVVKIKAVKMLVNKDLCELKVPVKELLEGFGNDRKKELQISSDEFGRKKTNGVISFSYQFGDKFEKREYTVKLYSKVRKGKSGNGSGRGCFGGCVGDTASTSGGYGGGHGHGGHGIGGGGHGGCVCGGCACGGCDGGRCGCDGGGS